MHKIVIIIISILLFTGCLSNLNVTEFFRKLEIKGPEYYSMVNDHRDSFEKSIQELIESDAGSKVKSITFWGEGRYACGNVVTTIDEEKYIIVLGTYQLEQGEVNTYRVMFVPGENGELINPILSR